MKKSPIYEKQMRDMQNLKSAAGLLEKEIYKIAENKEKLYEVTDDEPSASFTKELIGDKEETSRQYSKQQKTLAKDLLEKITLDIATMEEWGKVRLEDDEVKEKNGYLEK